MIKTPPTQRQFAAGEQGVGPRLRAWMRRYPAPLVLCAAFVVVLAGASVLSGGTPTVSSVTSTGAPQDVTGPRHTLCPICGIGESCDGASGRCRLDDAATPPACVKGSRFDEDEGYCVPQVSSRSTPAAVRTTGPSVTPRGSPQATSSPGPGRSPAPSVEPTDRPDRTPSTTPRPQTPSPTDDPGD